MSYATRADLASRYGLAEISDLERGEEGRIEAALADAAAEIDAALGTLHVLPLGEETTWPALVPIACDLARRNLYDDRESATVLSRAATARAALARLAAGEDTLLDASGRPAPRRKRAAHAGPPPSMTPDNLAGL